MRKIPAVILIIAVVIPLLLATLCFFSVSSWVLRRSFYRELLGDERLYSALLAEARARKEQRWHMGGWGELPELRGMPAEALAKALAQTLSAGYLRDQALALVEQLFAAAEGRAEQVELSIDLAPLKTLLRGEGRERFARALAEALPACGSGQAPRITPDGLLRCRPTGTSAASAAQLISAALPGALNRLPDRYPLTPEPLQLFLEPETRFWTGFLVAARLVWAGLILAVIAGAFWLGAAFLGGSDRREVIAFLGWSLFVPALLVLLTGLGIRFLIPGRSLLHLPWIWAGGLGPQATGELAAALGDTLSTVLHTVARGFLVSGAVSIGLALGLIAWSRSLEPEPPD
jgi:hypothetical protein